MSKRYKFFGIPKTIEEFIDKVSKRQIKRVNILLSTRENFSGSRLRGLGSCHAQAKLVAGKITLKLKDHEHFRLGVLGQSSVARIVIERDALEEAIKVAKDLSSLGFKVTIAEDSIEESEKILERYEVNIKEGERVYQISESLVGISIESK